MVTTAASPRPVSPQREIHPEPGRWNRLSRLALPPARRLGAWVVNKQKQPRTCQDHLIALLMAAVVLGLSCLVPVHTSSGSGSSAFELLAFLLVAVIVGAVYNEYYIPTLLCGLLAIISFRVPVLSAEARYSALLPGFLAGAIYFGVSIWWRDRYERLGERGRSLDAIAAARAELFEVGYRYLAAWATLMIVGVLAQLVMPHSSALSHTEVTIQEAGGIVVFLDLAALVTGRWRRAHRALCAAVLADQTPSAPAYRKINVARTAAILRHRRMVHRAG